MADVNVLMLGGRQCGKTSSLASIFVQMIRGKINDILTVCDKTTISPIDGDRYGSLDRKRLELESLIQRGGNNTFLTYYCPDPVMWEYTWEVRIPNSNNRMNIQFIDIPGSCLQTGSFHLAEIVNYIIKSDVILVVVDTPYIMVGSKIEAELSNQIETIHRLLINIGNTETKQVIFVPVKCEKWLKEGRIDEVTNKVEQYYCNTINMLKGLSNIEICVIPIQTAGDILFSDLRTQYVLLNTLNNTTKRCSKLNDRIVTLGNGKNHKIGENEILHEDIESYYEFGGITRRLEWFCLPSDHKAEYSPCNCEQVVLHILRFIYHKKKVESSLLLRLYPQNIHFGTISERQMTDVLNKISEYNLIKISGEGIKIIKHFS